MIGVMGLTRDMRDCARVIHELTLLNGTPPSYEEIRHELDLPSRSLVALLVDGLVERGWLMPRQRGAIRWLYLLHVPPPGDETPVTLMPKAWSLVSNTVIAAEDRTRRLPSDAGSAPHSRKEIGASSIMAARLDP